MVGICSHFVHSECINGCTGHGQCTVYDMCVCNRNWQGNDCSQSKYTQFFVVCPRMAIFIDFLPSTQVGVLNHQ